MNSPRDSYDFAREGLSPISRFRATAFTLIANLPWLKNNFQLASMDVDSFNSKNKQIITGPKEMTVFHKLIFFKQPNLRTQLELESLKWIFDMGFKFFRLCSIEIQIAFIRCASYKTYGPGRWILKEGYLPENMYVIANGHVRITQYLYDYVTKTWGIVEHCKLGEKQSFGESSAMFNTRRMTSAQSIDTVELICISKDDFMNTIKDNLKPQWDANIRAIKSSQYFKHLRSMELNKCSTVSFIKMFKQYKRVLGEGIGNHDCGHFIIEGEISLIHRKEIKKNSHRLGNKRYKYVDTCALLSNSYFNIGENMEDKEFLANTDVKVLCVPHWFMAKTEKLKNWNIAKMYLDQIIPNKNNAFKMRDR